jgi:hypothetical protein
VGGISDIRRRLARPLYPCTHQHPRPKKATRESPQMSLA